MARRGYVAGVLGALVLVLVALTMPPREPSLVWHPSPRAQRILDSLRR